MPAVNATLWGEGKGEALGWDVADQPGYSPNRNTAGALATLGIGKHTLPTAAIIKSFMRKDTLNTMKQMPTPMAGGDAGAAPPRRGRSRRSLPEYAESSGCPVPGWGASSGLRPTGGRTTGIVRNLVIPVGTHCLWADHMCSMPAHGVEC